MTFLLLALNCAGGRACDHVLLDEEKEDKGRDHPKGRRSHQTSPIRRVLLHEGLDADRHGHPVLIPQKNAGDKKLVVRKEKRKDGHRNYPGSGQRQDDLQKGSHR